MTPPKILLTETARWPIVALLSIGLVKAGNRVSVICPRHHPLLKSRSVRQTFRYSALRPLESLTAAIEATDPDLIIPCDERAVGHLHELHAQACQSGSERNKMAALIEKSLGPRDSYPVALGRCEFIKMAREEELLVPDSHDIHTVSDLKSWQASHPFPWVLKADGTSSGLGVKIAHNISQAERSWSELKHFYRAGRAIKRLCVDRDAFWLRPWWMGFKPAVIAQSYIDGRPANCGVVCWKGKVLAGISVEVVSLTSPTAHATIARVVNNPEMMRCAERIAKRLGLSGFFGLDFMIEQSTGLTYLIEINPRPTRLSSLRLGKGQDLIGVLSALLSGQPVRDVPPVTENKMIAYFPDAWGSNSELLQSSFHDTPEGEPELVQELLKPWPPRNLLWHMLDQVDRLKLFLNRSNH